MLLFMQDCGDWPVAFLGAMLTGVAPVAVNTLLTADDLAYMLEHSRAQAVFVSGAVKPALQAALGQIGSRSPKHRRFASTLSRSSPAKSSSRTSSPSLSGSARQARPHPCRRSRFLALFVGLDRPAERDRAFACQSVLDDRALRQGDPRPHGDRRLLFGSQAFRLGLGNALTFPLAVGATVLLMAERPTPRPIQTLARRRRRARSRRSSTARRPATPACSPRNRLPRRHEVALRLVSSAGEALPAEIGERFKRHFGVDIVDGIGSTEMLHIFLSNRPDRVRYGTTGWPSREEIELRGEDGRAVSRRRAGRPLIHGPSAALMSWGNRVKTRETFQGGWTKSGDKYIRNADGAYTYAGRSDDMLKVGGI